MKAIETRYKGYRFRSRLEARWAVFFDSMQWNWEYEPEGFDMEGIYYLPDFKVIGEDSNGDYNIFYFEVKPESKQMTKEEAVKIEKFSNLCRSSDHNNSPIGGYGDFILLDGPPDKKIYFSVGRCVDGGADSDLAWAMDIEYRSGRPTFEYLSMIDLDDYKSRQSAYISTADCFHDCGGSLGKGFSLAIERARSARFEHGECP